MGKKMAPSYANLFMGKSEQEALAAAPHSPLIWWRYIDDIFLLWTHGEDKLNEFITYLNNLHPTIKFTSFFSYNEIPFLDVKVMLLNGKLETDLYVKPTDKHQHLLKSSCDPSHSKQSIPFSMALRLRRICSTDEFFNTRSSALTTHLIKRGYKHRFVKDAMEKVRQIPRSTALETSIKKESHRIPFVITFNPALPNIPQVISSNLNILRSSQRCLEAFSSPPCISYHRRKNLCDILVRAKHRMQAPPHIRLRELSIVVTEIGARRVLLLQKEPRPTCFLYQRTKTSTTSHRITCSSSNLVYMIQCNKCNVHYIGESKRHLSIVNDLSDSFGEHRRAIEKAITKQHIDQPTAVSDHFTLPVHSMDNIKLVPLELISNDIVF